MEVITHKFVDQVDRVGSPIFLGNADAGLSAIVFTAEGDETSSISRLRAACLHALLQAIERTGMDQSWLLTNSQTDQPDSRITRYRGLWGGIVAAGVSLPGIEDRCERMQQSTGTVRFFGAAKFVKSCEQAFLNLIDHGYWPCLIVSKEKINIDHLIATVWRDSGREAPKEILAFSRRSEAGIILVRGDFDDTIAVAAIIGDAALISSIEKKLDVG